MTLTGPFIDQDMNYVDINTAYHLTKICLYKTIDLQVNPPVTGAIILAALTYVTEFPDLEFTRVRARKNYVYVLGVANISAVDADLIMFYSFDGGVIWAYTVIDMDMPNIAGNLFTLGAVHGYRVDGLVVTFTNAMTAVICSVACDGGSYQFTEMHVQLLLSSPLPASNSLTLEYDAFGDAPSLGYDADGDNPILMDFQTAFPPVSGTFTVIDGGYHFSGHLNTNRLGDRSILQIGWFADRTGRWAPYQATTRISSFQNLVIDGVSYTMAVYPKAMDIGKHDPKIVYVGTNGLIYKSTDGAAHFVVHIIEGASDIECHLAQTDLDKEITYWSAETGELIRTVDGLVVGVFGGVLDVTPITVPFRIASDPINGFPIWVLEHQGMDIYKLRKSVDGVVWTDVSIDGSTSMINARSLKEYATVDTLVRKIVFLKYNGIFYSSDETTFTNKKGNYPSWSTPPVVVNLW